MKPTNQQELIVSLITDDLIHTKLVQGLMQLGLGAEHYFLHLSDTVFELLEFSNNQQHEEVYQQYLHLCKQVEGFNITTDYVAFKQLALSIYESLLKLKEDMN